VKPATAYIALGSNLADPVEQVRMGLRALDTLETTRLMVASPLYRSAAVGYTDQPDFINAVACVETALAPRVLLEALLGMERMQGRVRSFANAPRTLDLDIVLYGELSLQEPGLTIPHPRLHQRAFVVVPLADIAPEARVPGLGSVRELLQAVDSASVERVP